MNNTDTEGTVTGRATPWHLWLVGVLAVLWNCMGVVDFLMTQTHNSAYLSALTPEQLAYFLGLPLWVNVTWGAGTLGGLLGCILLLLRKRWAVTVFALSLTGMVATAFYNYVLTNGMDLMGGPSALIFSAVIFSICVALLLYARHMARIGVLR